MVVKLGRVVVFLLSAAGCARQTPPAPAPHHVVVTTEALDGLRRDVDLLQIAGAHTCEEGCVSQIIGECVELAIGSVDLVSSKCVDDKSRACILNCAP
jgi:hypothetical protein